MELTKKQKITALNVMIENINTIGVYVKIKGLVSIKINSLCGLAKYLKSENMLSVDEFIFIDYLIKDELKTKNSQSKNKKYSYLFPPMAKQPRLEWLILKMKEIAL